MFNVLTFLTCMLGGCLVAAIFTIIILCLAADNKDRWLDKNHKFVMWTLRCSMGFFVLTIVAFKLYNAYGRG